MSRTYTTPIRSYARLSSSAKKKTKNGCGCGCGCTACRGLECLERPRYFAGQLLTEAELNSEQSYMLAKNRLHNRYLHGYGVVCGLEVVCAKCDGWVSVKEGYALDPCGNDIVVCKETGFNVLEEIRKCLDARRRADEECPPWQDPNADCKDDEDHWCITIRYEETEAKPTMPLRQESSGCESGCGCGGAKKPANAQTSKSGCSCGGGCGDAPAAPKTKTRAAACEPTRVLERFRLEIVPQPDECRDAHEKYELLAMPAQRLTRASAKGVAAALLRDLVPEEVATSGWVYLGADESPDSSLFNQILGVVQDVDDFLGDRLPANDIAQLIALLRYVVVEQGGRTARVSDIANDTAVAGWMFLNLDHQPSTTNNDDSQQVSTLYDLCCRFRAALRELYVQNPLGVRCAGFDCPPCVKQPGGTGPVGTTFTPVFDNTIGEFHVNREGPQSLDMSNFQPQLEATFATGEPSTTNNDDNDTTPIPRHRPELEPLICLMNALIDYIIDAICIRLLPPCPPSPCDDRLILACVTIKNNKITHICNFACRHYAGSFNSLAYWTSAVPVVSAIQSVVRKICCAPNALPVLLALTRRTRRAKTFSQS